MRLRRLSVTIWLLTCLFCCAGVGRSLHSFPTRRSSDLPWRCRAGRRAPRTRSSGTPRRRAPAPRSEEHTSELQSHSDLVCRLLLEKKKLRNINHQQNDRKLTHTPCCCRRTTCRSHIHTT